jgi:diguanylate cyclase (GGDEF)-like protein
VHQLVLALAGLGVLFAIGGVVLAGVAARRVAAPIQELTQAAGRIGHDPGFRTFPVVRGVHEVVQLSSVLRLLLHRLGFAEQQVVDSEQRAEEERQRLSENIDSLRHLAETDPLTGLLNRRALLGHCKHAAECGNQRVAVMMIDIDHFKSINDRYGHAVGDDVIRATAGAIAANIRTGDKVARFGGEEFIVLLTDIDEADLVAQAERIRVAVEQMQLPGTTENIKVTVSCGGAVMTDGDRDMHGLIARADLALYTAKNEGRNRVRLAPPKSAGQAAA